MTTNTPTRTLRRPSRGGWELVKRVGSIAGILAFLAQFLQLSATKAAFASLVMQVQPKPPVSQINVDYDPYGWFGGMFGWIWSTQTLIAVLLIGLIALGVINLRLRRPRG